MFSSNRQPTTTISSASARSVSHLTSGLRAFISKNTAIPAFFAKVTEQPDDHQPLLQQLVTAIQTADMNNDIFSHPDCMLYLVYLLENEPERLPFWSGVTTYHYLVALSQFTSKQNLKPEDSAADEDGKSVRSMRQVLIIPLLETNLNALTTEGLVYYTHVKFQLKLAGIEIEDEDFLTCLQTLPSIEQTIISLEINDTHFNENDVDKFLRIVMKNVPFFRAIDNNIFHLPSASIINYFLSKVSDFPMRMKPIFGKINEKTLHRLHTESEHPVGWYSRQVRDTLNGVHDYSCGPFVVLAHDIGHCFWASWLGKDERDIINHVLIPQLRLLQNKGQHQLTNIIIDSVCEALTDYDLTPARNYLRVKTRFSTYFGECLHRSIYRNKKHAIIAAYSTDVLIMLRNLALTNLNKDTDHGFWLQLCQLIDKRFSKVLNPLDKPVDSDDELERIACKVLSTPLVSSEPTPEPEQKRRKPGL